MTGKRKRSEKDVSRVKRNTAQKALQYEAMTDTGICVLGDGHYSVTLKLEDIDYQLAPEDDQQGIIEQYAQFINSFDAGQSVQLTELTATLTVKRLVKLFRFHLVVTAATSTGGSITT